MISSFLRIAGAAWALSWLGQPAVLEPVFAPDSILESIRVTGIKDPDARLAWLRRFLP